MWMSLIKFLHLAAAITWLGGIAFMLFALRPAALATLEPPQRLPLMSATLQRFLWIARGAIIVLLATGVTMLAMVGFKNAPLGWHLMFGIAVVMFAIFGRLESGPAKRLKNAVAASNWPDAGAQMKQIPPLAMSIFVLGWIAIAAMRFVT
jgi:uncharacterized membrane protein